MHTTTMFWVSALPVKSIFRKPNNIEPPPPFQIKFTQPLTQKREFGLCHSSKALIKFDSSCSCKHNCSDPMCYCCYAAAKCSSCHVLACCDMLLLLCCGIPVVMLLDTVLLSILCLLAIIIIKFSSCHVVV